MCASTPQCRSICCDHEQLALTRVATLGWGTLGRAELFRFRATVGATFYGIEAYTGFEYLDIDRTQLPGLLAGGQIRR